MKHRRKCRISGFIALGLLIFAVFVIYNISKTNPSPGKTFHAYSSPSRWGQAFREKQRDWVAMVLNKGVTLTNEPGKIPILMYHQIKSPGSDVSVPPENFEAQVRYLSQNGFHSITLDQYYDYRVNNKPLPGRPVILTFDDGYRDNYTAAYPILRKYGFRATVFVITGSVGREGFLTWDMIKEMYSSGLVDFGPHTVNHPELVSIPPTQAEAEISTSKSELERKIGQKATFFSYPYGKYNEDVVSIIQKLGFKGSVIMGSKSADKNSDLLALTRVFIGGNYSLGTFAKKVNN